MYIYYLNTAFIFPLILTHGLAFFIVFGIIFSAFGIPRYGIREISKNRDDRIKLSNSFWNLISIQFIFSIVAIIIYLILIFSMKTFQKEIILHSIMTVMIILNIFSIDWFYQGIEEYGYITIRNIIFKLISIILIFLIIKSPENYLLYAIINIFGLSFNNILNYINTKKYIDKKIYKWTPIFYINELKIYFITTLVVDLYTQLDQTFIGIISERDLAYYLRSKTVLGVGFSIVNSLIIYNKYTIINNVHRNMAS